MSRRRWHGRHQETNLARCNGIHEPCRCKGNGCECLTYHTRNRQLPACVFPANAESTYNRSFEHFARLVQGGPV
jgi:hypothetical protein